MRTPGMAATVATCAMLALVSCGDDDDEAVNATTVEEPSTAEEALTGTGKIIEIQADPNGDLAYTDKRILADDGRVEIAFENPASIGHNVVVADGQDVLARTPVVTNDEADVNVNLVPGEYTFYCSVDGHREAGMEGTLVIR